MSPRNTTAQWNTENELIIGNSWIPWLCLEKNGKNIKVLSGLSRLRLSIQLTATQIQFLENLKLKRSFTRTVNSFLPSPFQTNTFAFSNDVYLREITVSLLIKLKPSVFRVGLKQPRLQATAAITSLNLWIRTVSNFIALIPFRSWIWQTEENFWGPYSSLKTERKSSSCVLHKTWSLEFLRRNPKVIAKKCTPKCDAHLELSLCSSHCFLGFWLP